MAKSPYPTTPCVAVCQIDPKSGFCLGCYRTLKEIAQWGKFSEDKRQALLPELDQRREDDLREWQAAKARQEQTKASDGTD